MIILVSVLDLTNSLQTSPSATHNWLPDVRNVHNFPRPNDSVHVSADELHASPQGNTSLFYNHTLASGADAVGGTSMIEKIFLWTPTYKSGKEYELLVLGDNSSIINSNFEKHYPTYIIVHGFLGDGLEAWILDSKHKLMSLHNCNVISIQWPSGSAYFVIDYYHVVYHVPVVGKEIAQLLRQLEQLKSLKNSYVHIIGHSLGAHIAGFAGKNVDSPIARISGLDPAGLLFRGTDASQRLDKTDAEYVDVIHTNGCRNYIVWTDCFGIDIALGHTDFWPNGGRHQPACRGWHGHASNVSTGDRSNATVSGSWSVGCDHMMSHTYFVESLDYSAHSGLFLARPCDSYEQYAAGNCSCGPVPQYMGYFVDKRGRGNFYLNTSADPPYALPDRHCPTGAHGSLSRLSIYVCLLVLLMLVLLLVHMLYTCCKHSTGRRCCGCCAYKPLPEEADGSIVGGSSRSSIPTTLIDPNKVVVVL
ncbi:Lipase/vitellogenin [Trinorchestia longiramus]|nr:Lipase/vitellogenin [Trinorchestia longiramus]